MSEIFWINVETIMMRFHWLIRKCTFFSAISRKWLFTILYCSSYGLSYDGLKKIISAYSFPNFILSNEIIFEFYIDIQMRLTSWITINNTHKKLNTRIMVRTHHHHIHQLTLLLKKLEFTAKQLASPPQVTLGKVFNSLKKLEGCIAYVTCIQRTDTYSC